MINRPHGDDGKWVRIEEPNLGVALITMCLTKKQNALSGDLQHGLFAAAAVLSSMWRLRYRKSWKRACQFFASASAAGSWPAHLARTPLKMHHGHHGANHPVRGLATGRIWVVSMNHGFAVDRETLPTDVAETHVSLFDGSNCGIRSRKFPAFSVQFHPEASPGPQGNFYLFDRFADMMQKA